MSEKYLHREDARFGDEVWEKIDEAVVEASMSQLCARHLLHIEGPYGLGLKNLPFGDQPVEEQGVEGVTLAAGKAVPVTLIRGEFTLSTRDVAAFEQHGVPLDMGPVAEAAIQCARQEDALLFRGSEELGLSGILGAPGCQSVDLKEWTKIGAAVEDLIAATGELDEFVEEIPMRETRLYVKKVVGLAARYAVKLGEPYAELVRLKLSPRTVDCIDF